MDSQRQRARHRPKAANAIVVLGLACFATIPIDAQGCSQCREAVGQAPARTQAAYRRAIALMVVAGSGIFTAALFTLKRFR